MKQANVNKLEEILADYLQYKYRLYLQFEQKWKEQNPEKADPNLLAYQTCCILLSVIGVDWNRHYSGNPDDEKAINNIKNYTHRVKFPSDYQVECMDLDTWKEP